MVWLETFSRSCLKITLHSMHGKRAQNAQQGGTCTHFAIVRHKEYCTTDADVLGCFVAIVEDDSTGVGYRTYQSSCAMNCCSTEHASRSWLVSPPTVNLLLPKYFSSVSSSAWPASYAILEIWPSTSATAVQNATQPLPKCGVLHTTKTRRNSRFSSRTKGVTLKGKIWDPGPNPKIWDEWCLQDLLEIANTEVMM